LFPQAIVIQLPSEKEPLHMVDHSKALFDRRIRIERLPW
jgi:hypothetical protein